VTGTLSIERRLGRVLRLLPALVVVGGLSVYALGDVLAGSVGLGVTGHSGGSSLDAYHRLWSTHGLARALVFSLAIALVATTVAVGCALLIVWHWVQRPGRRRRFDLWLLHVNLSVPHVVWAVALLATFSQSGMMSRVAALLRLIDRPSSFPVLVQDRFGLGIILHLVTKELPFVVLATLPLTGRRLGSLLQVATTLGAPPRHRFRRVFVPTVAPAVIPAAIVVFAFALGSYEPGALLGVQQPRTLAVIVLERFRETDLARRPDALALSIVLVAVIIGALAAAAIAIGGRDRLRTRWR
jgi:putative spermidine/putrescine transport system permease protein